MWTRHDPVFDGTEGPRLTVIRRHKRVYVNNKEVVVSGYRPGVPPYPFRWEKGYGPFDPSLSDSLESVVLIVVIGPVFVLCLLC